jgi:hypothetical protein
MMDQSIRHYPHSYFYFILLLLLTATLLLARSSHPDAEDINQTSALPQNLRPIITIPPSLRALRDRKLAEGGSRISRTDQAE